MSNKDDENKQKEVKKGYGTSGYEKGEELLSRGEKVLETVGSAIPQKPKEKPPPPE